MKKLTEKQLNWIYSREWFPKYCTNLVKSGNLEGWEKLINDKHIELIAGAFYWNLTSEGATYWGEVDREWKNYLKKSSELVLTIDEIAKKFNTDPENIKIVK